MYLYSTHHSWPAKDAAAKAFLTSPFSHCLLTFISLSIPHIKICSVLISYATSQLASATHLLLVAKLFIWLDQTITVVKHYAIVFFQGNLCGEPEGNAQWPTLSNKIEGKWWGGGGGGGVNLHKQA